MMHKPSQFLPNGTSLEIEDGNAVDLSVLQDGVDDADNDPFNEIDHDWHKSNTSNQALNIGDDIYTNGLVGINKNVFHLSRVRHASELGKYMYKIHDRNDSLRGYRVCAHIFQTLFSKQRKMKYLQ